MAAHLPNELPGRMGSRRQSISNLATGRVTDSQLILVNIGIVYPVNGETTENIVAHEDIAFVVLEAERFEEILINNNGASRHNCIHHVVADEVDYYIFQASRKEGTGQAENDRTVF